MKQSAVDLHTIKSRIAKANVLMILSAVPKNMEQWAQQSAMAQHELRHFIRRQKARRF